MSRINRYKSVEVSTDDETTKIRLKTWSAGKLFHIVREVWGLIETALEDLNLENMKELHLIQKVVQVILSSEKDAAKIIEMSVDDPKGLTAEKILEWDACDFLNVVTVIVEMNVNEELVKNFQKLFGMAKSSRLLKSEPLPD
jgi:hypothetical protein